MNDNNDIPVIPDAFTDYLRERVDSEPAFMIAIGANGKICPCVSSKGKATKVDVQKPIKTTEIRSIDSAAIVSYEGSCTISWVQNGVRYTITLPGPCP